MKKLKIKLLLVFISLFLYAGSCSRYHIEGYIEIDRNEIGVNDTLYMRAVVTDEVEPFDVSWYLHPNSEDAELIYPRPGDETESKYEAIFLASEPGNYNVSVVFLYKNTAPQPSDTISINVY